MFDYSFQFNFLYTYITLSRFTARCIMADMDNRTFSNATEFSVIDTVCLQPKANHVGLLGGTFNPVHNGHLRMARVALDEFMLGEVVFIPSGNPPHKRSEAIVPAEHRMNMLRLAISGENRFSMDTLEVDRPGLTYTVDTLEALLRVHRDTVYHYIIGADTLYELPTWRNFERVITLTCFICVLRPGVADEGSYAFAEALNSKYGPRIVIAREKGLDISSSLIRSLVADGQSAAGLMPEAVSDYIKLNRLYRQGD